MHIEGTYTLHAPLEHVWYGMHDQHTLLHAMPGMKQIEALDEHTFAISLAMNQEPFIGNYQGKLTISEQQFPYHYHIAIQGTNDQGQFQGEVSIDLQDRDESTIVSYTGAFHLASSGDAETASTTLARGAAKLLIQQFFTALNNQLQADIAISEQRGVFYTLVHLLGLGHGEPEQEQMWTRRLRRTSTIASLLFLVWLGTRIPRPRVRLE